jgi:hypothetical protein
MHDAVVRGSPAGCSGRAHDPLAVHNLLGAEVVQLCRYAADTKYCQWQSIALSVVKNADLSCGCGEVESYNADHLSS